MGLVFFIDLGNIKTNDAGCTCEIISKTASSKAALNKTKTLFVSKLGLDLRKKVVNCWDRLCGLVVRVSGYRYRGLGFDSRRYQIFRVVLGLERGPLSLVRSIEELLE